MDKATLNLDGREYVVVLRQEYDRLRGLANLPTLPNPDKDGNMPAVAFGRASLARKIIRGRIEVGMSQKELAAAAGIRVETLCRIETGKHSASVPTIDKIDRALKRAEKKRR
ncbi:MAG: helix-turn-helix transcriptional regulator [Phycisphaerales bacterium]|jgi:DNA-binding XRE family transcriptional regulator